MSASPAPWWESPSGDRRQSALPPRSRTDKGFVAWEKVDGPHPPQDWKKAIVEPARREHSATVETEVGISSSSTKAQIVSMVAGQTGIDVAELNALTKAQLLERFAQ